MLQPKAVKAGFSDSRGTWHFDIVVLTGRLLVRASSEIAHVVVGVAVRRRPTNPGNDVQGLKSVTRGC